MPANFVEMLDGSWALPVWRGVWFSEMALHFEEAWPLDSPEAKRHLLVHEARGSRVPRSWSNEWRGFAKRRAVDGYWPESCPISSVREAMGCGSSSGGQVGCAAAVAGKGRAGAGMGCFEALSSCAPGRPCLPSPTGCFAEAAAACAAHFASELARANRRAARRGVAAPANVGGGNSSSKFRSCLNEAKEAGRRFVQQHRPVEEDQSCGVRYRTLANDPVFRPPLAARHKARYVVRVLANAFLNLSWLAAREALAAARDEEGEEDSEIPVQTAGDIVGKTKILVKELERIITLHEPQDEENNPDISSADDGSPKRSSSFDSSSPRPPQNRNPLILKLLVHTFAEVLRNHPLIRAMGKEEGLEQDGTRRERMRKGREAAVLALAAKLVSDLFRSIQSGDPLNPGDADRPNRNSCAELFERTLARQRRDEARQRRHDVLLARQADVERQRDAARQEAGSTSSSDEIPDGRGIDEESFGEEEQEYGDDEMETWDDTRSDESSAQGSSDHEPSDHESSSDEEGREIQIFFGDDPQPCMVSIMHMASEHRDDPHPCNIIHYPALSCTTLHHPALLCTTLHCPALPCTTTLHFPALPCTTTLHYPAQSNHKSSDDETGREITGVDHVVRPTNLFLIPCRRRL